MYLNPNYTLQSLSDTPYLLPFGAGIASFRHPVRLDPIGAFLWDSLKHMSELSDMTFEETALKSAELICREYELPVSDVPEIKEDMTDFFNFLKQQGILTEHRRTTPEQRADIARLFPLSSMSEAESPSCIISIADMEIELYGKKELFREELFSFEISDLQTKNIPYERLHFYFIADPYPYEVPKGCLLIDHPDLKLFSFEDGYHLQQPSSACIDHIFLKKDGSSAFFYLTGALDDLMRYDVFHAIRLIFSYAACLRGDFLIHSASILYREKAWLFSAVSGTGKSTHAALWMKLYENEIRNLNGDLNLITIKNGIPTVYGIPWNGTSGIYSTDRVPLGGIIFLKQAKTDFISELSDDKKSLSLLQRLISPNWTEEMLERQVRFANELISQIFVTELSCTPQPSAAKLMRQAIDDALNADSFVLMSDVHR